MRYAHTEKARAYNMGKLVNEGNGVCRLKLGKISAVYRKKYYGSSPYINEQKAAEPYIKFPYQNRR